MGHDFSPLEEMLGYKFKDISILETALTHSTYANEAHLSGRLNVESNERLEFFGDSILSFIISEEIIKEQYSLSEGMMSKLRASIVCEKTIASCAREIDLSSYIRTGRGLVNTSSVHKNSVLADTFEAVIAAIYIDGGMKNARRFVLKMLGKYVMKGEVVVKDNKSLLQEIIQKKPGNTISYELMAISGPEHGKIFTVDLVINGKRKATGRGSSIKEAEQKAAGLYLKVLHQERKRKFPGK